jgi:peptide/nickel transport system permease protein
VVSYIIRRLLALVPLLIFVSFVVFGLSLLVPGDPARTILGFKATQQSVDELQHRLWLDRPFLSEYWHWLTNALHGDLGHSWYRQTENVRTEILHRFPVTFSMAIGGLAVTVLIGVPAGLISGTRPQSSRDRAVSVGSAFGIAAPDFWLAMMLISIFAVSLKLLPAIGYVPFSESPIRWYKHLVLVWLAIGIPGAAAFARQLRGALIDAMDQDYIRTARAKGLRRRAVIMKHALKNAAIAPVTVLGLQFAYTLGGTVVLERIFSMNGLGQYFFNALSTKDLPVIQAVTLVVAVTFIMINLFVDILYAFLNPKVRFA